MGEPAKPTRAERAALLDFATRVVESVDKDLPQPEPRFADGDAMPDDVMIFKLAQLLVDTTNALHQACTALDTEGLEETAHRLRNLDLEVR
ncbi:MAG TPA: hypothetical protein VFD36_20520 [Kofleriaceae bacterium]|nr:hypothetical protein [Kofleriaceae bacterium]